MVLSQFRASRHTTFYYYVPVNPPNQPLISQEIEEKQERTEKEQQ